VERKDTKKGTVDAIEVNLNQARRANLILHHLEVNQDQRNRSLLQEQDLKIQNIILSQYLNLNLQVRNQNQAQRNEIKKL
jgi:rRNA maturation endonuclease Nob1